MRPDNTLNDGELNDFQDTSELIYRIRSLRGKKEFEKLELLLLKSLLIVMEYDENAELSILEENLEIIDNVLKYYKKK